MKSDLHHDVFKSQRNEAEQSAELYCGLMREALHGCHNSLHSLGLCHPELIRLHTVRAKVVNTQSGIRTVHAFAWLLELNVDAQPCKQYMYL